MVQNFKVILEKACHTTKFLDPRGFLNRCPPLSVSVEITGTIIHGFLGLPDWVTILYRWRIIKKLCWNSVKSDHDCLVEVTALKGEN